MKKLFLIPALLLPASLVLPLASCAPQAEASAKSEPASQSRASTSVTPEFDAADREFLLSLLDRSRPFGDPSQRGEISARFNESWIAPTLEVFNFVYDPTLRKHLLTELKRETGQDFGTDMNRWFRWLWNEDEIKSAGYDQFKADFYGKIDSRFTRYFEGRSDTAPVPQDEIRWGGVHQDGIPPLRNPKMLRADQADYLSSGLR